MTTGTTDITNMSTETRIDISINICQLINQEFRVEFWAQSVRRPHYFELLLQVISVGPSTPLDPNRFLLWLRLFNQMYQCTMQDHKCHRDSDKAFH